VGEPRQEDSRLSMAYTAMSRSRPPAAGFRAVAGATDVHDDPPTRCSVWPLTIHTAKLPATLPPPKARPRRRERCRQLRRVDRQGSNGAPRGRVVVDIRGAGDRAEPCRRWPAATHGSV